jgi:hypothetical protein
MVAIKSPGIHDEVRWEIHRKRIQTDRSKRNSDSYSCALILAASVSMNRCTRTIRRWLEEAPQPRDEHELTPDEMGYIRLHDGNVYGAWEDMTQRGLEPVGYKTLLRAFNRLDAGLIAGLRGGVDAMRAAMPYLTLPPASRPNEIFEIDHTLLKQILIRDSLSNRRGHPWLTIVIDVFTRTIVGFSITLALDGPANTESAFAAIADALIGRDYDGTFVGGMPEWFRFDQGSDFMNGVADAIDRLGGKSQPTEADTPEHKAIIERVNRTIKGRILPPLPGYGDRMSRAA